jgi:hypothetical protein
MMVEATDVAGLGGSGRTRLGICDDANAGTFVADGEDWKVDGVRVNGESGRLNGEDRCAPNDRGLGFFGEVCEGN